MNEFYNMPLPPSPSYQQLAYDAYGNPIQAQVYAPTPMPVYPQQQPVYMQPQQQLVQEHPSNIGFDFSKLVGIPLGSNAEGPAMVSVDTKKKNTKRTPSSNTTEVSTKQEKIAMVEELDYDSTYQNTNRMLLSTIVQTDEVISEAKIELNKIRAAQNMKGKYTYLANVIGGMNGLLSTKVAAIREINSSTKAINEAEYRRYKDNRSSESNDNSKYVMDMYNAMMHTPTGVVQNATPFSLPSSLDITAGLNGVVRADIASPNQRDMGMQGFLSNMTPEQNAMIMESNPYVEEVIIYDQATGKKYFSWVNIQTGEHIQNMPATDPMFLEDYVIDPRKRTAKNANLRTEMKVIYENEGRYNEY